ncbi:MAG: hypothetical protein WD316_09325 [Phycisphaeraceae bacterium]
MAMLRAGEDLYREVNELARTGRLGLEVGVIMYAVCPERAKRNELVETMKAGHLDAGVVDAEALEMELEDLAETVPEDERDRLLRCGVSLWRVDQEPMLLEAVVRHVSDAWLRPAGARLLGLWVGGAQPASVVLAPRRHLRCSDRPDISWTRALIRSRHAHLPCEYFVTGLPSEAHAGEFMAVLSERLTAEEPGMAQRLPLWTPYRIDRVPVREDADVAFDPELGPWVVLSERRQHVGVHLYGEHDAAEHEALCRLLMAAADEMGGHLEGAIRPNVDVYRQHR